MATPPTRAEISGAPSRATANAGFGKLWDYVTGLLGSTGNQAEAQTALNVPSRTGGNASGTWGISISGNAATATTASNVSRSVTGAGLATGGGTLSADQTITVTKATKAQAEAGTDDATAMTPLRVEQHMLANALGWGQTYSTYDATARATDTSYQNTTGRPIIVSLWGSSGNFQVSADGSAWTGVAGCSSNAAGSQLSIVVLPGYFYRMTGAFTRFTPGWVEIR